MAFIGSINFKDAKPPARIHIHESSTGIYGTSQIEMNYAIGASSGVSN